MKTTQITTAAALFCEFGGKDTIPLEWFQRAIRVFEQFQLSPILFTAGGGRFELDDCYVLAESGGDLVKWGEGIAARHDALVHGLERNEISSLYLDSPRPNSVDRSDWRATVSASLATGKVYLGADEELVCDPVVLLRQAYEMAGDLFDVRYGFAYKMPLADEPDSYASGIQRTTLSDFRQWLKRRSDGLPQPETPDELWHEELRGQRRHLTGLFRGAYPANILSDAHIRAAGLNSAQLGRLSELGNSLWLWELSENELPLAAALLSSKGVLVSQVE